MTEKHIYLPANTSSDTVAVLQAATRNEEGSRDKMRALLVQQPHLLQHIGTLTADVEAAILESNFKGSIFPEEAARAEMRAHRDSLSEPRDGALERMLIERIVLGQLALQLGEQTRAAKWRDGISLDSADFWDRHVSRLHADLLHAIKALAKVRRLRLPAVQVNVAQQQVNVAG